jgi:uncharacterized protein YuzE
MIKMAKINTKIDYNKEEDIFYLSKQRSSRASIEVGDFIIDIDSKGFVSAIEILNASENLGIKQELLEISPETIEELNLEKWYKQKPRKRKVELREYQNEAISKWIENDYMGIFEMATGTGKTFAAIGCAICLGCRSWQVARSRRVGESYEVCRVADPTT